MAAAIMFSTCDSKNVSVGSKKIETKGIDDGDHELGCFLYTLDANEWFVSFAQSSSDVVFVRMIPSVQTVDELWGVPIPGSHVSDGFLDFLGSCVYSVLGSMCGYVSSVLGSMCDCFYGVLGSMCDCSSSAPDFIPGICGCSPFRVTRGRRVLSRMSRCINHRHC